MYWFDILFSKESLDLYFVTKISSISQTIKNMVDCMLLTGEN